MSDFCDGSFSFVLVFHEFLKIQHGVLSDEILTPVGKSDFNPDTAAAHYLSGGFRLTIAG